jgi:phage tail-like protein
MATGERVDPYRAYNFVVEIDDTAVAGFSEVTGLTFEVDMTDYREGADKPLHVRKLTGLRKFSNITLKRGLTDNRELYEWYRSVLNGIAERRNGAVILNDEDHNAVARWNFRDAYICNWEGPSFSGSSNDVAIESIQICAERVELE